MSKGSISKKKNPTPEKGIRKNEKEGSLGYILINMYFQLASLFGW